MPKPNQPPAPPQAGQPVDTAKLTAEAQAFFCGDEDEEVEGDPGLPRPAGRIRPAKGPLAPVMAVLIQALLPKLLEFLASKYTLTPKGDS